MTDSPETPTENSENSSAPGELETLLVAYENGVANRTTGDVLPWLAARSDIAEQEDDLTPGQEERLQKADETLIQNAGDVLDNVGIDKLRTEREASDRGADEWWWHLDTLAAVPVKKQTPRQILLSRLFTAAEVGVLIIAVFLLLRNANIFPPAVAPTATRAPTFTPAPTGTVDPDAFDITKATKFTSPDNIVQVMLPKGWSSQPTGQAQIYQFSYATGTPSEISMQVLVNKAADLYNQVLRLTQSVDSPKAAIDAFKKSQTGFTFGDTQDAKVGANSGSKVLIDIPPNPQSGSPESLVELWIITMPDGQLAMLILNSDKTTWESLSKPILYKMIDTMVIDTGKIPTLTPTPTLHPLEMSKTAIQLTVNALTPTNTATLTPSITPTPSVTPTSSLTVTPGGPSVTPFPTDTATSTATATSTPSITSTASITPTPSNTATLHPLFLTQTAVQGLINALTPSNTPLPTNTSTPSNTPTATTTPPTSTPSSTSIPATNTPVPSPTVVPSNTTAPTATATPTSTNTATSTATS